MLPQIQAYVRKAASRDRDTERIGTFLATFTSDNANPYLNYAIPDDGASPTSEDVTALIAAFERHERKPRLEFIPELAPQVEAALRTNGFSAEGSFPLMIYDRSAAPDYRVLEGVELVAPQSDAEILGMIAAQNEAYGEAAPPDPTSIARWHNFRAAGGIMVYARERETYDPVGGGVCDAPFDHTTELAGIGVRPAYRRRGVAAAMTRWLVDQALAAGTTTVFLTAAGEAEARIYGRVGFRQIGSVLHISRD